MARWRMAMTDILEIIVAWDAGEGISRIARRLGYTRMTVRKYAEAARALGALAAVGDTTGECVDVAFGDRGYTGALPAADAAARGLRLVVGKRPQAKRGFVLRPKRWVVVEHRFRDGHTERWWTLEVDAGPYGAPHGLRAVVATTDPATLPDHTTWYLATNLPPGDADPAEVARLYGLRMWVEQCYKQTKSVLGWGQ